MLRTGPRTRANGLNDLARNQDLAGQMFENSPVHRIDRNFKS
jgi:hypothetical protein